MKIPPYTLETTKYLMNEISNVFGIFLAAVITGPAALANTAKQYFNQQSPEEATVVNNLKVYNAPFLKILRENCGVINCICRSYGKTRSDREDLYQEIILQLWLAYPSYRGDSKISSWIYSVAFHAAIMPFRRKTQVKIELHEVLPERASQDPWEKGLDDRIYHRLQKLANYEKAILMLMMEGFTTREIGAIMEMREGTVNKRLNRMWKTVERIKREE